MWVCLILNISKKKCMFSNFWIFDSLTGEKGLSRMGLSSLVKEVFIYRSSLFIREISPLWYQLQKFMVFSLNPSCDRLSFVLELKRTLQSQIPQFIDQRNWVRDIKLWAPERAKLTPGSFLGSSVLWAGRADGQGELVAAAVYEMVLYHIDAESKAQFIALYCWEGATCYFNNLMAE